MEFIRSIMDSPLYTFLFGSGGILIIIVSVLGIIKKNKHNNSKQTKDKSLVNSIEETNLARKDSAKEFENISFVGELTMNSPVKDKIKLEKIDPNDKNYF